MLDKYTYTEKKATRDGFGAAMTELGRENKKVVALCADLIGSLKINTFIQLILKYLMIKLYLLKLIIIII